MFTNEMKEKFKRAGEYQKLAGEYQLKAIKELFPEGADEHMKVIAGEMKAMFEEAFAGMERECNEMFRCAEEFCKKATEKKADAEDGADGEAEKAADEADDASDELVKKVAIE